MDSRGRVVQGHWSVGLWPSGLYGWTARTPSSPGRGADWSPWEASVFIGDARTPTFGRGSRHWDVGGAVGP